MTVTVAGWLWLESAWHLVIGHGRTVCGHVVDERREGPVDGPDCRRCTWIAVQRGIEAERGR